MIRNYSLNNESKSLYEDGILHDMFVSSEQLINALCHIVLYRDDSNNVISFILRQLLSINAPPNDIVSSLSTSVSSLNMNDNDTLMDDDNNNTENIAPSSASRNSRKPRNPRKRTREQMSSDDNDNDCDNLEKAKIQSNSWSINSNQQ